MRMRVLRVGLVGVVSTVLAVLPGAVAFADATRDAQWSLGFLHVAELRRITQGDGVTIAVVDTGVDASQQDLVGSVLPGLDAWTAATGGHADSVGHGTAVAALIAGHGHGASGADGILGVAPKAKILPVSIYAPNDPQHLSVIQNMTIAIRWAVDQGAQVINISSGGGVNAANEAAVQYALDKGVPVVAAAANDPKGGIGCPACQRGVIGVTSVDSQGSFAAAFSSSGQGVSFSAPGANIILPKLGGGYRSADGNSYAAALTSGIVALIRAKYPTLTPAQIYDRLKATAVDKGDPGWDEKYGYGVIDPVAALTKNIGDPSASASTSAMASAPSGSQSGMSSSKKLLLGLAGLGGLVVILAILTVSVLGLSRRRRTRSG